MNNICDRISHALARDEQFTIDKKGVLHIEGKAVRFIRKLFGRESAWILNVSQYCNKILDQMETNPTVAEENLDLFEGVKDKLSLYKTKAAKRMWSELSIRVEALKERLNTDTEHQPRNEDLVNAAQEWKDNYELYEEKELTAKELEKLDQLAQYPGFAQLVIDGDKKLKDECFKWILRDNNNVEAYVKFPTMCKKLKTSLLAGRIGRFAATSLKVENNDLTLPFEKVDEYGFYSQRISILDGKKVVQLRGGYSLSIDEIFNTFKQKNDYPGDVEYFGKNGITNFNSHELGWWNESIQDYERIDLDETNWWEHLPVYETLSQLEVRKRFNLDNLEPNEWVAVVRSTTESLEMDIDKSHGYLGLAIPQGQNEWRIYDFGKYAEHFPSKLIDKLFMLANTVHARISYFDENDVYSHRIQAKAPIILSEEQGQELMEDIKEDILKAREGNIVFQFGWENCAYWPQEKLNKVLGDDQAQNFFRAPAALATPKIQPLKWFFATIRSMSQQLQKLAFRILAFVLRGKRGVVVEEDGKKVNKCLINSGYYHSQEMFHPAFHHKQIRDKIYPGLITFGNLNTEFEV